MKNLKLAMGCLLLLTMGSSFVMADESESSGGLMPRLGVEGGINLANLNGANANDVIGSRLGFVAGGFLGLPLGPGLTFQPELLYEQKGGKFNGNPYQLDYVELPLLLNVGLIGPIGVILGPSLDLNVAYQGLNSVSNTDIGLVAGVQFTFSRFLLSGRYEIGLTQVNSNASVENGTFTFLAGLSLI